MGDEVHNAGRESADVNKAGLEITKAGLTYSTLACCG